MSASIHHIAIAVHNLDAALALYRDGLGLEIAERRQVPKEGVEIAFLPTASGDIELLQPLDAEGSVARFLAKQGEGLHHICLTVEDLDAAMSLLREAGARLLSRKPLVNIHGTRYVFVNPRSAHGVLLEIVELSDQGKRSRIWPSLRESPHRPTEDNQ